MRPRIFILDDNPVFGKLLSANLGRAGEFKIERFEDPETFLDAAAIELPDAVFTDLKMPGMSGIEVIRRLRAQSRHLPIFLLTAYAEIDTAVEALKAGATDYLSKPLNMTELATQLRRALEERPLKEDAEIVRKARKKEFSPKALLGEHPKLVAVREFLTTVAQAPSANVLLQGETGTGKNLAARIIHHSGPGTVGKFVEVNCSAIPATLLEAELFGYRRGAFTDAKESKKGLIEVASGGTLFLDEIGDLNIELQSKILNFLESKTFRRLGGTDETAVDLRVITATNQHLEQLVTAGTFRQDLFYRIQVVSQTMPPLREISSDIEGLCLHFLAEFSLEFRKEITGLSPDVLGLLQAWDWPGNVRELRNILERACIFCKGNRIELSDLPPLKQPSPYPGAPFSPSIEAFAIPKGSTLVEAEAEYIRLALAEHDGNVQLTAEGLGISRKNLWEKRKKYGLLT
jgi:DNA-binding NtrC family response regulator